VKLLDKIQENSPKVLVVGDIMLDRFIFGDVDRISPEAPVPVVRSVREKYSLGGCGNVLRNLINLGIKTYIVSCVGKDQAGKKIIEDLNKKGCSSKHIKIFESIQTTEKMRIVAEGQQLVRVDWDTTSIPDNSYETLKKAILINLKKSNAVVISDYNKGFCTDSLIKELINQARKMCIPILVDPKGDNWEKYSGSSIITPNIKEAEELLGKKLYKDKEIENAGIEICSNFNIGSCLITRGANGMSYISKRGTYHVNSEAKEIFDVSGAGDTVIASFASGLALGLEPSLVTDFANKAAGIVVGHIGTTAINISELKNNN